MQKLLFTILIFFQFDKALSQTIDTTTVKRLDKSFCLLTGLNYSKHAFADVGISVNKSGITGHHPISTAYFFASEFHFVDKPIVGPKVGVWTAGGITPLAIGLNLICYSNFDESSLVFRPEIGLGFGRLKITYGYNARLTNTSFDRIAKSTFGLTYCFKLRRLSATATAN